ncbi:unnamed protein product [Cylindrotheca closterium]|uniref:ATP-dependent transporter ycf16 n=1 Tax=Cylindrotheca closterium TaxID=2856 RepID=A0AAD2CGA9_9STRA|nr:unnamed protein product [Cylindrotheca closterium]
MNRSKSFLFRVLLFTLFTGLVSPFALGESSSGSKGSIFRKPRTLAAQVSTTGQDKQKSRARLFLETFDLRSRRHNGAAQKDATSLTVASRLLFLYVTPMLDLALNRTLTENDAFAVPESKKMKNSVDALSDVYERFRKEAEKSVATNHGRGLAKLNKSKSFILFKAIVYHQRRQLFLTGLLRLVNTIIQAFPAVLVSRLLKCIEAGSTYPAYKAVMTALLLVSVLCLKMIIENQFFHNIIQMSTQTRGSLEGLIFDKSLRLPDGGSGVLAKQKMDKEKKALGSGGVLNLMQSDASIIESAVIQIHTTWDGLLQIAIYTSLLFKYLGPSVFWGISVLLSVIPLNSVTLRLLDRLTQRENEAKDARTKRTTESITNMKLLKVQAWEDRFAEDIRQHRRDELARHKARGMIRSLNSAISNCVPSIVLVVTLTAYAGTGNPIVASTIFTAISLFNQLRFPLFFYPMLVDSLANGKNSLRRISSYLTSEELTPYTEKLPSEDGGGIEVENGNFLWPSSDAPEDGQVSPPDSPALCNANLKVNSGEIVAVVGSVGSGKTALLLSLLGELAPVPRMVVDSEGCVDSDRGGTLIDRPKVTSIGTVAYCSQDAWIPKGTIRNAVVFGRDYDEDKYTSAIYDAGLDQDIENGVFSHETDVGEGGSSLSGGQRARVALARALYSGDDTKVFLLDDCLAALDASMGSLVFERLRTRLKRSKAATLIVTNDPSLPRQCDRVVLMGQKPGGSSLSSCSTTIDIGSYDELLARGHQLSNIAVSLGEARDENLEIPLPDTRHEISQEEGNYDDGNNGVLQLVKPHNPTDDPTPGDRIILEPDAETGHGPIASNPVRDNCLEDIDVSSSRDDSKILSADEKMSTGAVPMKTYTNYLKAVRSPKLIAAMLVAFVATNGAQFFQQYTVAKWTELAHGNAVAGALGGQYLKSLVYAAGAVSVFLWFRSYFTMLVGLRASDFYHDRMVRSVFRAPMSFFDSTPSGQILSRFGKEMETIDRALPESYASVLFCALQISSSVFALAGAVTPTMIIPIMFASLLYYRTMRRFRRAARDMKRSETKTRSPIFTHFGETLRGTATIRSIPGAARTWSSAHRKLSDANLSVYSTVKALDRWLSTRLEALGNFMVLSTAIASVILSRSGRLLPGKAGWGLTQSLAITGLMAWAVRNLTMLENHMMSVMRVREMTDLDESDGSLDETTSPKLMPRELSGAGEAVRIQNASKLRSSPKDEKALLASGWPWKGGVSFQNVSMRYNSASPLVLKKLSIDVPAGSTLGVVGRTGSGKSSLLLTLFRIVEIEMGGSIQIDSVDIRSVGLKALRESLSIIPQDPVLFTGTVRTNLDPTSKRSDDDMWKSLEAASPELAKQFYSAGGLETPITEGGSNLSQGQRQLVCLARALLRSSKILVLDEATSSVDAGTDKQVQDTIRSQFVDKGVTVITVAHRLDTIMNYDKVAVLGDGALIEYGVPARLANQSGGEFKRLVDADRKNKMRGAKSEKEDLVPM